MSLPADLRRPLRATALRIRVQRAMDAGAVLALAGLGLAAVVLTLVKTRALPEAAATGWLVVASALPIAGIVFGALRPISPLLAAKLLDRAHGLADRTTNAVAFSDTPERTPFMSAAIDDAVAHANKLSAKRAMPLAAPSEILVIAALAVCLTFLFFLEVPREIEERTVVGGGIQPVSLHADDLDAFDSELRELMDDPRTPDDVRQAAREFNRLIEDLADERLDRAESLRRIAELEQQLLAVQPADAAELRESLEQLGEALDRSEMAESLSEAMREGDAEQAEAEMRALAERLRQEDVNRAELERLRQALARAAQRERPDCMAEIARLEQELAELRTASGNERTIVRREAEIAARRAECEEQQRQDRQEELQRLLQRQREQSQQTPQDRRLLQRRERELDRLRRESQQDQERRRQLDRLQRQMNRSAEELNRDREEAAEQMEQGAEQLNRMAQQQMSEEEMERMRQQLEELRELIRRQREQQQQGQSGQQQQGQGGQGQRRDRFALRARGEGDGQGVGIQRPGQGGQQGQQQGQGQGEGQGQQGEGQQMLQLGGEGGNALLEIPGMGGQEQMGQSGQGRAEMGPGAGEGHDPTMLDDPTLLGGDRQTVRVEGQQSEGPVRSDVEIYTGAQRGFTSRGYRDVHTRYEGHAEEVLERDQVPPGYRFYVRRYFQLIRPRER